MGGWTAGESRCHSSIVPSFHHSIISSCYPAIPPYNWVSVSMYHLCLQCQCFNVSVFQCISASFLFFVCVWVWVVTPKARSRGARRVDRFHLFFYFSISVFLCLFDSGASEVGVLTTYYARLGLCFVLYIKLYVWRMHVTD